jgi:hypothetical protein
MTIGPLILPAIESDSELAHKVVKRVIKWDQSTPDPFRDHDAAKSNETQKRIAELNDALARLPEQISSNPARIAKAHDMDMQAERQVQSMYVERCGPGTLDPVNIETASKRIKSDALSFTKSHPFVLARANETVKAVDIGSWKPGISHLPGRITVFVTPASGKAFYAEVDAKVTITADRKLGPIAFNLVCLTDLWIGQRDASWKDVCRNDPNATSPN